MHFGIDFSLRHLKRKLSWHN